MECQTAQRLLQVVRPAGGDLVDPDLAGATEHAADCPDCLGFLRAQQAFDVPAALAIRSVPIPAGLSERIHERLEQRRSRRRYLRAIAGSAAAAAACLAAAAISWWPRAAESPTPIASKNLAEDLVASDELDVSAIQAVPDRLSDRASISQWCQETLRRLRLPTACAAEWPIDDLVGVGRTTYQGRVVAVFQFEGRHGPSDVVALPRSLFAVTDLRRGFQLVHKTRHLVVIAWTEQDAAYFAILKGWAPEHWKRLLAPVPGLT